MSSRSNNNHNNNDDQNCGSCCYSSRSSSNNRRLLVAALLSLPALLISLLSAILVAILSFPSLWLLKFSKPRFSVNEKNGHDNGHERNDNDNNDNDDGHAKKEQRYTASHAIITGGSSGIGLAVAKACVGKVDRITILARTGDSLRAALDELATVRGGRATVLEARAASVTDPAALATVAAGLMEESSSPAHRPPTETYLYCCAGTSHPGTFDTLSSTTFQSQANTNYLGTVYTVQAFLPYMRAGSGGMVVLVSSMAGQLGLYGYSAYAPTKFALRGLAETLHMELLTTGVRVQVVYPPDTDTPGFAAENALKPAETKLLSGTADLLSPQAVGDRMVEESYRKANPRFHVSFGLEGWMLTTLTCGMSPEPNLWSEVAQVSLLGLLRFVSLFYLNDFWNLLRDSKEEAEMKRRIDEPSLLPPQQPLYNTM